ncbi:sodium-dependent neutral amino acid transporter B(0)AT3 isoform X1 [Uranotaenia lowii]|uniref:sodium-dependent neutral amino acid transporter B(0)AT3 isoform X1 n=2 Tax=Uranotaenia lowii TaxID=190385 RepID=UPI0024793450|nr:sodium-dependent neutral amino acid transporter B(0)AT3 isoform X1 [Uranotaenia lowii]XP_055585587.1 sodium-dependent neutral amino acid transporter B(0)AT3 isoform X1 [Uranotaenia lowii]XP_055585588.1 sodium-dependent neutral amino acid transporter B(0)AT3 isoform X1 [Uranotaenia lowii]XP_055585589.1 sodium-dependent neutral amino acid transporter B(0)AT3 isoform X1 [Uranotaenia lowii]XP_055585590.1 sodium-dependent neutral amino acid transporter B(0)AT3 isoform X1 [Uranotaenia lowii]XP_05
MANTAHLFRRQSSRDLIQQATVRSLDELELRELRSRLVRAENGNRNVVYGATNQAFISDDDPPMGRILDLGPSSAPPTAKVPPGRLPTQTSVIDAVVEESVVPERPEDERESWDSKWTFLLATIGYAVGLGNVWRFPYLAQKNGGGAFLVPYFVMLLIQGLPIFYLELAIGQRLRKGAIGVWHEVSAYLGGIGISSAFVSYIVALYYNTIIAWCLIYLLHSFESPLPWAECPKRLYSNFTYDIEPECVVSSPTKYYWYRQTLQASPSVNEPEDINYTVAIALITAWFLVYICMVQGITESSKIVYVTAIFPYVVLIIFFFRGITLKGASDGVAHLFTPRWEMILEPVVWLEAGTQIFFSLGLAFGGLIAFSSYNPANNNCYRDALVVSITNCSTSMFAGMVVFSVIGFKATSIFDSCVEERDTMLAANKTANLPVCDLQKELENSASGTGLAFIIFTEAINQFPMSQLWAVLFFLMLFTLGIDSQFGTLEGVTTSLVDMKLFPNLPKEVITGGLCLSCSILSMCFANGAGSYIFQLMDSFAGSYTLLIIAFFECISVSYIYGIKRFADDIELMTGSRPGLYWMLCWKYISPIAMITILTASFVELASKGSSYPGWNMLTGTTDSLEWPHWCIVVAILLVMVSILWIPGIAICRLCGINIIEDSEPAWFPSAELRDVHGIVPHEPTDIEISLFCIRPDGSEGLCCPTYGPREQPLDEDDEE